MVQVVFCQVTCAAPVKAQSAVRVIGLRHEALWQIKATHLLKLALQINMAWRKDSFRICSAAISVRTNRGAVGANLERAKNRCIGE
jgi:hypothetical protein